EPHHVLVAVGVAAGARGRGVGRALVQATVDRAGDDPGSRGVRLETENSSNVDRYSRWGFELRASVDIDPVTVHVMTRSIHNADKEAL
ncbi:MAG: GNAT family N-acetyltransferase, partial [Microcella sp.]